MSYSKEQLENWLKTIDVNCDNVLDIGGSQNPILNRTKTWNVKNYKILDLEIPHECEQKPDILQDLNKNLYQVHDFKTEPPTNLCNYFDIAFCLEVSEYLYNPLQALDNIAKLLKQGGILYISFHFIYPHHNPVGKDYLRYTRWGIEKLLTEAGFKIEEIKKRFVKNFGDLYLFYQKEGMKMAQCHENDAVGYLVKAIKI